MKARPFKQDTGTAHPKPVTNEYVKEALAKQAASRPANAGAADAGDADAPEGSQAAQAQAGEEGVNQRLESYERWRQLRRGRRRAINVTARAVRAREGSGTAIA